MTDNTHGQVPASSAVLKAIREANMQLVHTGDDAYMLLPYLQAHVQNPAEIEHVAGDVSKNGAESNMAQQPATSAACPVDNNKFDHQTADDVLNGKTVSDEAMRKFVAIARWAHYDRVGLRATLLSVRGELASREAEIALLKKALLEAETAPQPAPAPLSDDAKDAARYRWLREGNDAKHGAAWHVAVNLYGCEWDAAIDAALAAQGGKA